MIRPLNITVGSEKHGLSPVHYSLQRPSKQLVDTIEYKLEQLDDPSIEALKLLKETTDSLIEHMEQLKSARTEKGELEQQSCYQ